MHCLSDCPLLMTKTTQVFTLKNPCRGKNVHSWHQIWVHTQAITYWLGAIDWAVTLPCLCLFAWSVASVSFRALTPGCSLYVVVTVLASLTLAPGGRGRLLVFRRHWDHFKVPLGGGQGRCPEPIAEISGCAPESSSDTSDTESL